MTIELASQYRPEDIEKHIAGLWNDAKAFHAEPTDPGRPYSIVIPPPNVTAALHMGHALNNTLQDILIRWRRMQGRNAMWMPGTDHAGIATQTVVEKRVMEEEGKKRTDFDRDVFVAKIQAWKDEYEKRITDQLIAMGCSCDFDRQRFTMDNICARAVREAFFRLFKDGLIYRGKRLVNWDPVTQTALADDEVEMREIDGNFYYLRYPLTSPLPDGTNFITVATTRPETMLGDTAVAINPRDPRAAALKGRMVLLPIVNREIPIIEDDYVVLPDPNSDDAKAKYATGFLKVTPAHDPNDYEIGQRHKLPVINVMGPDGSISKDHGWPADEWNSEKHATNDAAFLLGMSREKARKAIVAFFKEHQMLEEIKPYKHSVGHSYRSHVPIEPYLSDQWYVKVKDDRLAGAALRAMAKEQRTPGSSPSGAAEAPHVHAGLQEGQLRFFPARYAKTFETWHENIRDWCISRQLWWGHRIPVWRNDNVAPLLRAAGPAFADNIAVPIDFTVQGVMCSIIRRNEGGTPINYICVPPEHPEVEQFLEAQGWVQDPDVLDTWFSSALWPLSTLGWPDDTAELQTWNPTDTLCTAREIITLWVSRMVMFNIYFRNGLPFKDVFIHAMIQDGHGQKMSKSLGNGVDPMDIIHSHGSDAMRFTLAGMTTQTQDVRLPVDIVCPFTQQSFTPKYIGDGQGHKVAAPIQESPHAGGKKFMSSYGIASGKAKATADMPAARNTSEKFDVGRNFANKLWNAVRFALGNLSTSPPQAPSPKPQVLSLPDRWILSRLVATVRAADKALENYEFKPYADGLYDFIWRDFCDWYIEAIKPTVQTNADQQRVLVTVIDVILRLLHPVMPYITEQLWEKLNEVAGARGLPGLDVPPARLLVTALWPMVDNVLIDTEAEKQFEQVRELVSAVRQVRTSYKVPPRQMVECSAKAPAAIARRMLESRELIETLANIKGREIGPNVDQPQDAAVTVVGEAHLFLHGLIDADAEKVRLGKRIEELTKSVANLTGRLSNSSYVDRAPANLVQQTRDQLGEVERELKSLQQQLEALNG